MAGSIYDWSLTAGSNASADGDINWTEGQLPSTVNDSARVMMKRVAEFVKDHGSLSLTGTDTLTVTANSSFTAYATGRQIVAKVANTNTSTTVTLNVNGIGAKRVKVVGSAGEADPEIGSIRAGQWAIFNYDAAANSAAGAWILLNPLQSATLTGAQPLDADLTAIAALTSAANKVPYSTGAQAWALADFTTTGRAIVAATVTADQILYGNGSNTVTTASLTSTGRALIASSITTDQILYGNGAGTVTTATITAAGRQLIDDADAAAQRTTLGLTAAATATYTEGTFTPTLVGTSTAGTGTYIANSQVGRYTRIGNRVFFTVYLGWTAHTGTGNMQINGLPITSANNTNAFQALSVYLGSISFTGPFVQAYVAANSTSIVLGQTTAAGSTSAIPIDTAGNITVSGNYEV